MSRSTDKTMINRQSGVGMASVKQCLACGNRTTYGRVRRGHWHCLGCAKVFDDRRAARLAEKAAQC